MIYIKRWEKFLLKVCNFKVFFHLFIFLFFWLFSHDNWAEEDELSAKQNDVDKNKNNTLGSIAQQVLIKGSFEGVLVGTSKLRLFGLWQFMIFSEWENFLFFGTCFPVVKWIFYFLYFVCTRFLQKTWCSDWEFLDFS